MELASRTLVGMAVRKSGRLRRAILSLIVLLPALGVSKTPLLVLRPEGKVFNEVIGGLEKEIGEEYDIQQHLVGEGSTAGDVGLKMRQVAPKLIVLMDNRIINLYRKYQGTRPESAYVTPSVSLMAASLEREIKGLKGATGISYEIPIVTSALSLRSIINKPIPKLGIVHREFLRNFIAENSSYCKKEGIEVVAASLRNKEDDFKKSLKKALGNLFENDGIDALWVPNDNALLSPDIIRDVWIPMINKHRKPVIVGVETLVNPKLSFGTFAVLPDHVELGRQLAEMILEISEAGFVVESGAVNQPLSVIKTVNLRQARKFLELGKMRLGSVDKVLE